jgi:4-hydroxy-tetrahydrodipicolinate synthase
MSQPLFTGVGVALVTLFDDTGEVDNEATAEHAARLVDLGLQAVVVVGSTGEAAALDAAERVALIDAVRTAVDGRVPVLAGTGAPSARQAAALTAEAADHGIDGALVLSPAGASDPRPYYDEVAKAVPDLPLLAYHFPKVAPPGVPVELLPELPVAGCKDSSGEPERLLAELAVFDRPLYTGSSAILSFAGPLGCAGAILALANAEPEGCVAAFAGDAEVQQALLATHIKTVRNFPRGIKQLTADRFGTSPVCRMG